jgi:hypothetical protein
MVVLVTEPKAGLYPGPELSLPLKFSRVYFCLYYLFCFDCQQEYIILIYLKLIDMLMLGIGE